MARVYGLARRILPVAVCDMIDLRLEGSSALVKAGWPASRKCGLPIDAEARPLPWYTYAAIRFLQSRVPPDATVFEYGMGNSTLWWAARAANVESCEHDQIWFDLMKPQLPQNVTARLYSIASEEYIQAAASSDRPIDILIIDGRRRVSCARAALGALSPKGVIIWDNSDRDYYVEGIRYLAESGHKGRIDFWGMGPINTYDWCTSIIYRPDNCLGI